MAAAKPTFNEFLAKLKDPSSEQLKRELQVVISEFCNSDFEEGEDMRVMEALTQLEQRMAASPMWRALPPDGDELASARECLEKYLLTKVHRRAWRPDPKEVEHDQQLDAKLIKLSSLIRADHLDIPACFRHEEAWHVARRELQRMNSYKAPRDKLVCVLGCCKAVNVNLKQLARQAVVEKSGKTHSISADDFLPVPAAAAIFSRIVWLPRANVGCDACMRLPGARKRFLTLMLLPSSISRC